MSRAKEVGEAGETGEAGEVVREESDALLLFIRHPSRFRADDG